MNENKYWTDQNLWDMVKLVLREIISVNVYKMKPQINNQTFHLKTLRKKNKLNLKQAEVNNDWTGTNEIENRENEWNQNLALCKDNQETFS